MKLLAAVAVLAGCALAVLTGLHPWGAATAIGVHPYPAGTPWEYQLLSGFVPALTVLSLATLLAGAFRHVNCHQAGCWRIGRHKVDGTPWCGHHHDSARPQCSDNELLAEIRDLLLLIARQQ